MSKGWERKFVTSQKDVNRFGADCTLLRKWLTYFTALLFGQTLFAIDFPSDSTFALWDFFVLAVENVLGYTLLFGGLTAVLFFAAAPFIGNLVAPTVVQLLNSLHVEWKLKEWAADHHRWLEPTSTDFAQVAITVVAYVWCITHNVHFLHGA